jgi:hypothetical protein
MPLLFHGAVVKKRCGLCWRSYAHKCTGYLYFVGVLATVCVPVYEPGAEHAVSQNVIGQSCWKVLLLYLQLLLC